MDILRLVTVHPILVHVTLGGIPLMLLAYAVAARIRSPAWLFAGDFVLFSTALATVLTGLFGFVSFFVLDWPGGLDLWRWLHLSLGVATAGIVWVVAAYRLSNRRKLMAPNYFGLVGGAAAAMVFAIAAGWVGGEVLVYRAGTAVLAAQNGALSPPVAAVHANPTGIADAMGRVRGHLAAAVGEEFGMMVEAPRPERFDAIAEQAVHLQDLARWLSIKGEQAHEHGEEHEEGHTFAELSQKLGARASELEDAARRKNLLRVGHAIDGVQGACASCHLEHRWRHETQLRAQR